MVYGDPTASIAQRVRDLLSRMTVQEKVGQMLQLDARCDLVDAITTRHAGSILHASPQRLTQAMDLAKSTRLAIPLLTADDAIHGHSFWPGATILPSQLAMACTWNPDLIEAGARLTALEVAATGIHWTFSPVLCIARDLRWGRVGETFGEDPFLIGELGAAMVRGYQGNGLDDPTAVLACAKHFAGYSETQGGRDASEADISRRKLRSWFFPPFERVSRQGCRTFMLGYQSMDGVPITANSWLLNDVLKGEWGFTGTLVTDWDNVGRMVYEQGVCADITEAAALAVRAGNDLIMTTPSFFEGTLEALRRGLLVESDIDRCVERILRLKFELGLFENPRRPDPPRQLAIIGCQSHAATNLEIARRSIVLLRNNDLLPLPANRPALKIAIVGPNANDAHATLGDWAGASGQVDWMPEGHPRHLIETVLDGFLALSPEDWEVQYSLGARIADVAPNPKGDYFPDGQPRPAVAVPAPPDPALLAAAVELARSSDVVIAVVGDNIAFIGEGRSTATLELVGQQIALLDTLAAMGKPLIVVLLSSKPMVLPESALKADALIVAFNPGMRGGRAIAELVLGAIEPSGRLPISFARHVGQQPTFYNAVRGQHGDRYADLSQEPQFAFGEGLSYSTVNYSNLRLASQILTKSDAIQATVTVKNNGRRPVVETVQAYISDVVTSATWADYELKAFQQIEIQPGKAVDVDIVISVSACTIVNAAGISVVEPGNFELLVGPNSRRDHLLVGRFTVTD